MERDEFDPQESAIQEKGDGFAGAQGYLGCQRVSDNYSFKSKRAVWLDCITVGTGI